MEVITHFLDQFALKFLAWIKRDVFFFVVLVLRIDPIKNNKKSLEPFCLTSPENGWIPTSNFKSYLYQNGFILDQSPLCFSLLLSFNLLKVTEAAKK